MSKSTEIRIMVGVKCAHFADATAVAQVLSKILKDGVQKDRELIVKQIEIEYVARETKTIKGE